MLDNSSKTLTKSMEPNSINSTPWRIWIYFITWILLIIVAAVLNALNIDWINANLTQAIIVLIVLTILQGSALEFILMTVVSLMYGEIGGHRAPLHIACNQNHKLSLIINFNLLASSEEDVESAYLNMYNSFMGNLSPNMSVVLVSATRDESLKQYEITVCGNYRALIEKTLMDEAKLILNNQSDLVNKSRFAHFWRHFEDEIQGGKEENSTMITNRVAQEFMCIHRVSCVLKKCGQYQDLFLLSEGETKAFSYTDRELYSSMARPYNELLFHSSKDMENIHHRQFDYCLVMDSDTVCPQGTVQELLSIAAAHPDRGIIQPSIKMSVSNSDPMFMHLERWRQKLNEPLNRAMATFYGQWGFYGKGLINIKLYVKHMIGTREAPKEVVPLDVLSHDTYEAAILCPLYVDSLYLGEEPSYNYITWHIRERRWNHGELILSKYFWPRLVGYPVNCLQKWINPGSYVKTAVRTKVDFGLVSTHVAHSAIRSMLMKPLLLAYFFLQVGLPFHQPLAPLVAVLLLVCFIPKLAILNSTNAWYVFLETITSVLQYTPEAVIGSVRLIQAFSATISCSVKWTPQRVIEGEMRNSNPFLSSIRYLWMYSMVAVVAVIICGLALSPSLLIYFLLPTVIVLPFFTAVTSLNPEGRIVQSQAILSRGSAYAMSTEAVMEEGIAEPGDCSGQGASGITTGEDTSTSDECNVPYAARIIIEQEIATNMDLEGGGT